MIACLNWAAHTYHVQPAALVRAWKAHKHDGQGIGPFGIEPEWLPLLEKNGFSRDGIANDICASVQAEAAVLSANAFLLHQAMPSHVPGPALVPEARDPATPIPQAVLNAIQPAAHRYQVPVRTLESVYQKTRSRTRSGRVGPMGIPEQWLPILKQAGFPSWQVRHNIGWNVAAAAWILAAMTRKPSARSGHSMAVYGYIPNVPNRYLPWIDRAAHRYRVDPALIEAVMAQESGFDARAISSAGADGLMQLMPATALRFGVTNPFNPRQAIDGGTAYLAHLLRQFGGNVSLALAGYNAGGHAVIRWGGIPPYTQTQRYVPAVLARYRKYAAR